MSQPYSGFDPQYDMNPKPPGMPPAPAPASGLAITSLVMGILGWTALPVIGSLVAIVTGHMAVGQIRREPYRYGGKGLAIAGMVLGYVAIALGLLAIIIAAAIAMFFVGMVSRMDFDTVKLEHDPSAPVAERVVSILAEQVAKPVDQITPEKSLAKDLGLDELDMVEVVIEVEEAFDITIDDAEVEKLKTVQDLIDLVERKKGPGMGATIEDAPQPVNALPQPPAAGAGPAGEPPVEPRP